jgi:hypothetical protein
VFKKAAELLRRARVAGMHASGALGRRIREATSDASSAIADCHAEEIAQVLSKLAAILGAPAGIGWLDEGFKIVVDAAEVSNDVYDALLFVKQDDYFMAGYEIAKLAVVLVA